MGLTKQYVRYVQSTVFGVIGSNNASVVYIDTEGKCGGSLIAVPAVEHVIIWNLRKKEKVLILEGDRHEVTALLACPKNKILAVGYADGMIKLFDLSTGESNVTFSGHKSSVSALAFDRNGLSLASGSKDTDVILWDVVNESGLYRLKGHKGMVTQCHFMTSKNILITSSKDTYVKFWDLDTQHCFKTLVGHRAEVCDFVCLDDSKLITGSVDSELRVWYLKFNEQLEQTSEAKKPRLQYNIGEDEEESDEASVLTCVKASSLMRDSRERVVSMGTDRTDRLLCCHGPESSVEVFLICTDAEAKKRFKKRQKRARRQQQREHEEADIEEDIPAVELKQGVEDEFKHHSKIMTSSKIRSFDAQVNKDGNACIVSLLHNNSIEVHQINVADRTKGSSAVQQLTRHGHRSDVRTVCFSSDNTAILTASADSVKLWNRDNLKCIRSMSCGYALCSIFVPGDRHCIVGTKQGNLQLFDIASGVMLEQVAAHDKTVWSVAMMPNKRGFISGGTDKTIKFWEFELVDSETCKRLSIEHKRTLEMSEDVLCVKYSSDQKYIAVALLDSTVKVFFADTLKFFLSLYGHKLPVLSMDISSDSTLIVTGSADKNIKIWGLDYGDCHRSIFAHDDSVMGIQFVPQTHLFFTCGKDSKLKQWDADNYENITTLGGHQREVWCLSVSPNGNYIVTGSHDKSLRLWQRTDEPLVLEEQREMEREKLHENAVVDRDTETVVAGETTIEAVLPSRKTMETVRAAERIMEAIELFKEEHEKVVEHQEKCKALKKSLPAPKMHPLLVALGKVSPTRYVLDVIKKVRSSELEEALLVLPFHYVLDLLKLLDTFLSVQWEAELSCRCLLFLLKIHHGQITSNQVLLPVIDRLRNHTSSTIGQLRDTIGFNMAAMQFLKTKIETKNEVTFFTDATEKFQEAGRKRKQIKQRKGVALITM